MVDHHPLISLGMPVYNGERFVQEAIESVLAQTFGDFELIISDNASTDGTYALCQDYARRDSRVRVVRNEQNIGAAGNFNRTVALARGKYFKWASYDDLIAPTYLSRCADVLNARPDVVLCYPRTRLIDGSGEFVEDVADGLNLLDPDPCARYVALHRRFQVDGRCNPVFGLMRLNVLKKTPLIAPFAASDATLLAELVLHGGFFEIADRLFMRRSHPGMSTLANPGWAAFATWFDPANANRILLPRWRHLGTHLDAINRAPLSSAQKLRCTTALRWWFPEHYRGLVRDLVQAGGQLQDQFKQQVRGLEKRPDHR